MEEQTEESLLLPWSKNAPRTTEPCYLANGSHHRHNHRHHHHRIRPVVAWVATFARMTAATAMILLAVLVLLLLLLLLSCGFQPMHDDLFLLLTPAVDILPHDNKQQQATRSSSNDNTTTSSSSLSSTSSLSSSWFTVEPATVQVQRGRPSFPSFWDAYDNAVQHNTSIAVSYDKRSILLSLHHHRHGGRRHHHQQQQQQRVLLLGGSMHPIRATRMTWEMALDQAVQNGLNLITMYVFWSAHQPFPDQPYQWSLVDPLLQTSTSDKTETGTYFQEWELADAIASCARRGLFVHIRIGPYVCAEYSYGGIPEWLPLSVDNLRMRRLDPAWMQAMEMYVANITAYLSQHQLWATQRGPIILAQIENELGEETTGYMQDNKVSEKHQTSASNTTTPSHSSIQEYANWCGSIAAKYIPEGVVLTMCNGLSANNTVDTHNGDSQFIGWLEHYGDNGRIQIDQPALWTEDEGGFQLWGEESGNPVDYFWGHTARYMTKRALQWFARGGCHLNYYMWWGGYNRARMAAAGILNAYATDTVLCSSGQRHQPKFDHFQAMHTALADVSDVLMASPSALFNNKSVDVLSGGTWKPGDYQTMFVYRLSHRQQMREVMFVENNADTKCTVRVHVKALKEPLVFDISPDSAVMIVDGNMRFDSGLIDPNANAYVRREQSESVQLLNWSFWSELIEEAPDSALSAPHPIEQTDLAVSLHSSSDYAFYRTSFDLEDELETSSWCIQTQKGNGIIVFVDGTYIGSAENHEHSEGDVSVNIVSQRRLLKGNHTLSILSVSFGYHNLIGRWTAKVGAKQKGITGQVSLISPQLYDGRLNLDDGRTWTSDSGLKAGPTQIVQSGNSFYFGNLPLWSSTNFFAPHQYDATKVGLFVKLTDGRGNFFLNGIDLGRFWNITRGETDMLSMTSYFLPPDFLLPGKKMNSLVFFNEFGQWFKRPTMFLSWLEPSEQSAYFPDEVDYESSCVF